MTGGAAFVLDVNESFHKHYNRELVKVEVLSEERDRRLVHSLIQKHYEMTSSRRAREVPLEIEQRLPAYDALRAYTVGAAFANHLDATTGRIEAGRYADLVILDADLSDPESFEKATVTRTFVDGAEVYSRPA